MAVIVAIDAGTSGIRAAAIDEAGAVVARTFSEFSQSFPKPGWVEHDLAEIWSTTQTLLLGLAQQLTEPVTAIGITNQRETVCAWRKSTSEPASKAIVWQDRRTTEHCRQLQNDAH